MTSAFMDNKGKLDQQIVAPVRLMSRTCVGSTGRQIRASKVKGFKNETIGGTISTNEMDTLADTSCAGCNWTPVYFTGDQVDVAPFTDSYQAMQNIPVATCATLITAENEQQYMLIGHEMLFFGSSLKQSLLNPNQLRMAGVTVVDDPTVEHGFGIHTDQIFIPFQTAGTTVYFESEAPTLEQVEDLSIPHIVLTSEEPWDPQTVQLRPHFRGTYRTDKFAVQHISSIATGTKAILMEAMTVETGMEHLIEISPVLCPHELDRRLIHAVKYETRHSEVNAQEIAKKFQISLETAERTLQMTTQQGIRQAIHPLTKRYRVDHLYLNRRKLPGKWYSDHMFSKVKSLEGNTCAFVITKGEYTSITPMESKKYALRALHQMDHEVGTPEELVTDLASELSGKHTDWMEAIRKYHINIHWTEKGRKNQNHQAEREIGELKRRLRRRFQERNIPKRLWDRGLMYEVEILNRTSRGQGQQPGLETVTGRTQDISEYCDFEFYDLVWYYTGAGAKLDTTNKPRSLGRWIGVSHRVGSDMAYWIVTASGKIISGDKS